MRIEELPDYPVLQQLGRALWKVGKARGAAVLVGAGFSRNADRIHSNTPLPPLWTDFARAMQARIYPNDGTAKNPLRLAEEYKALLGEPALEGLIREMMRDEEWLPGELHKKLVQLPWTDVLTTNWDTLIERAAFESLGQSYETVRCIADIANTRAPRVVKLHGSLPSNRPFIFSEEDYRTYPRLFAPFVNLVQQVLLENELCLLGFSGDDPNFLEWSGWVRDQLGASARRIHLIGALGLHPAQRRLLESRYISAIDFSPLILAEEKDKHLTAATLFLDYLRESKPRAKWDWPEPRKYALASADPQNTPEQALKVTRDTLTLWRAERVSYPGWLICPLHIRDTMKTETIQPLYHAKSCFAQLHPHERGQFIFELAWRFATLLIPLPNWFTELFQSTLLDDTCWRDCESRHVVALTLLRTAREERDQPAFSKWLAYCQTHMPHDPSLASDVLYERCLWARNELNFAELRELIIGLEAADPVWHFRRAALLCDLGDINGARDAANVGLRRAREHFYRDRDSVGVVSRLAWAQFLLRGLRSWLSKTQDELPEESEVLRLRFFETKSDPWETLQALDLKIEEDVRRVAEGNRTKEPQFEPGTYQDHSSVYFGTWWPQEAIYEIERIIEIAGVPARAEHTIIMEPRMRRAEALSEYRYTDDSDYLRALRVSQSTDETLIERVFGRIPVATIGEERCAMLRSVLARALDYALEQLTIRRSFVGEFWSRRAAMYMEILSRLSVRLDSGDALSLFRKGLAYTADPRCKTLELFSSLGHLLERSFLAISPPLRRTLVSEIINFPLPDEAGIPSTAARDWPEPSKWLRESVTSRPAPDTQFAARVSSLIEKTTSADTENRSRAVLRLATLFTAGTLSPEEAVRFGTALWSRRASENGLPADTTLYSHMFLVLPSPDREMALSLFLKRSHEPSSADYLISLGGAGWKQRDGSRGIVLTKEDALLNLGRVLHWQPQQVPPLDLNRVRAENERCRKAIGAALANAILPVLTAVELTSDLVDKCFGLLENGPVPSVAQALPELVRIDSSLQERAVSGILQTMVSRENDDAWAGFNAIYRWVGMHKEGSLPELPRRVVDAVISIIEARRMPGLLHALNIALCLIDSSALTQQDCERVAAVLRLIFLETDYRKQNPDDPETGALTLVRAEAVKMADALRRYGTYDARLSELLVDAERDPMPEVRFAVIGGVE